MYENNVHYCLWMLVQSLDARRKIASSASILRYLAPSFEVRTFCVETLKHVTNGQVEILSSRHRVVAYRSSVNAVVQA